MDELMIRDRQLMGTQRVQQELMRQGEQMQLYRYVAQGAMEELGRVHNIGTLEAARTLATAQLLRTARMGQMSPLEDQGYQQADAIYMSQMLRLMQGAGERILQQAGQAQLSERTFMDGLLGR